MLTGPREVSLTKEELAGLVDRVYALWNQTVPQNKQKEIYQAWFSLVGDISLDTALRVVEQLALDDTYMPRPGTVARAAHLLESSKGGTGAAPSWMEAWAILQKMAAGAYSGATTPESLHVCLSRTITLLGGTAALGLHTNGDRNSFAEVYRDVVKEWENDIINKARSK
jgi:hypothetical protein